MDTSFEDQLHFGDEGEDQTKRFMLAYWDYAIIHTSKIQNTIGKGARLDLPSLCTRTKVPIPDFLCIKFAHSKKSFFNLPRFFFMDLKTKRKADYYRNRGRWETGMDARCRQNYLNAESATGVPTYAFHLIYPTPVTAMDAQRVPPDKRPAPTGLFGCPVSQHPNEYKGMVYWGLEEMMYLATLEEVSSISKGESV